MTRIHCLKGLGIILGLAFSFLWNASVLAIEVHPNETQIAQSLEQGDKAALARIPPNRLYAWFGSKKALEPHGFLMTKLGGLAVMGAHFSLRSAKPDQSELDKILKDELLLITVVVYGDRPDFSANSYMILTQGQKTIKPSSVRFDGRASKSSVWPDSPAYRAKVIASIPYSTIDPLAKTTIVVIPGIGEEVTFQVDFSTIQ